MDMMPFQSQTEGCSYSYSNCLNKSLQYYLLHCRGFYACQCTAQSLTAAGLGRFQMRVEPSLLPVSAFVPSGENATE